MPTKNINRSSQQTADQQLIDGLTKHAALLPSLVINGASHTTADIITVMQARLAASTAAQSTRASWQNAVKADVDERAKTKTFVSGLRQSVKVAFAGQIDALADFGLTPPKPRVVSPEAKVASAAKAKATRAARHTMGKVQKLTVKGTVPVAAPATPPAPAPAPAGGTSQPPHP